MHNSCQTGLLMLLIASVVAHTLFLSRPLDVSPDFPNIPHIITLSDHRLLLLPAYRNNNVIHFENYYVYTHLEIISTGASMMFLPANKCFTQNYFSFNTLDFLGFNLLFVHLKTCLLSNVSEDIILIAFEFSSSNSNNQYDQLSLKVFSLLNLQETNTFEFIVENDLLFLYFKDFSLKKDQSFIANFTIAYNSNQCTIEFPHEVQFNSIVSCSFCISNTGCTNTSSLQIIDNSIELQTNATSYCSFLKESVPLFLLVSDYKLVIRDAFQRRSLEVSTSLSGVRSVDYISSTDSKSLFLVLVCKEKENNCKIRQLELSFNLEDLKFEYFIVSLAAGEAHSVAALADGTVKTWGSGGSGRLGHGLDVSQLQPKTVDGITDAVSVSCGSTFTLVLRSNGQILAFGDNLYGQIGDGSTMTWLSPVTVVDLNDVIAISAGHSHSLALRRGGRVFSWGSNEYSQLGRTPTTDSPNTRPGLVPDLINVVTISTRSSHNLAVRSDGSVASWGLGGSGRLGNGGTLNHQSIQKCGSFSSAVNVSAAWSHSLILLEGGDLRVTGANWYGQLGLGDTSQRLSPVRINGFKFAAVTAGASSNIGVLINGNVVVWGRNEYSQLGDGTTTQRTSPIVLNQFSDVYVFSIWNHALIACKNGSVLGWGHNEDGKIGDGTTQNRITPVEITELEV
ncbi:hypothetical protein RCL1_001492 [Eukaryota sp. TZLM3-RCL]